MYTKNKQHTIMSKKNLIVAVLLFLGWGAQAQDEIASMTYEGQNDSRAVVMTGLQDGIFTFLSEDNRYLSGGGTGTAGFVYDFKATGNKLQLFPYVLHAYFAPDHYVASPLGESTVPYLHYKDQGDIALERTIHDAAHMNDISYWNAQPNGNRVVMLAYEWDYGVNGGVKDSAANPVGTIYNGKTGKIETLLHSYWPRKEPLRHEDNLNYGTRAHAISADGKVVGGWGTWPTSNVISTWQTMFWDLADFDNGGEIHTYAIEDYRFSMSDLVGANRDGSILVGYNEETEHGLIVYFDRANKSFTIDTIDPLPGYGLLYFNAIDDNNLIYGYCGVAADPGTRKAVVYTKETGLIPLSTYIYEYYDIDVPTELGCPTNAAIDGSIVAGFFFQNGYTIPWFIQLGSERILPRARNVKAKAIGTGLAASITWQKPLVCEYTLTGYEIYRDDEAKPIATIDKDALSYSDEKCEEGYHTYKVVALYGTQKADPITSNKIMTGTIFPVQQIGHQLKYNRYASVYWGLPSSEVVSSDAVASVAPKGGKGMIDRAPATTLTSRTAPANTPDAKQYNDTLFDYIYSVNELMYDGYCGIKIGDEYFVSSWRGDGIQIIDQYNEVTETWRPAGLNESILSMVYFEDKQQLYCGGLKNVYILDLTKRDRVIGVLPQMPSRHLSYLDDFEFNGTKGVFLAGGWDAGEFFTIDGEPLGASGFDFTDLSVTGTAYYDGKLYVASQTGKYQTEIYTFDVATRRQIGEPVQVIEDPAVYNLLSLNGDVTSTEDLAVAGGLTICTLEDGTVALAATYQCSYVHSQLMFLELKSAPDRRGYDLYRNGEPIARNLRSRRFYDELDQPGTYTYEVKALYTNSEAEFSPATTLKIDNYGSCLPVKDLTARETNQWVVLDWDVPTSDTAAGIVGFTVFRDGVKLKELYDEEVAVFYNDLSDLKIGTPYTYAVETLYKNGCKSSDSVKITLTDEGTALAPFGLRIDFKKNAASTKDNKLFDVTAQWETPLFEDPLAIGYGTGQLVSFASFGDEIPTEYWALIGWSKADLELYKDLYLVGMEYLLGDNTNTFEAVVYLNDEATYRESPRRAPAQAWQTMYFSRSFPMDQPKEVTVGYHITYDADAAPIALDFSASKRFYSDIISWDGANWYCLADNDIAASWTIHALVARKRDLDAATTDGVLNPALLEGKTMRLDHMPMSLSLKPTMNQTMAMPSPKAPLTLKGFNLYRQRIDIEQDEIQLNDELLTTQSFTEAAPLPEGDYDYTVEAVYANTTKPATVEVTLTDVSKEDELNGMSLTLYPNPASEIVYVDGEYTRMEILDLGGRVLRRLSAASQIDLGGLTPGTYFFRFTDEAGRSATYKVVVK